MNNGDRLKEALDSYINKELKLEPRPDIEAVAIKMRDNEIFRIQMLGFWTIICADCPSILSQLNIIVAAMLAAKFVDKIAEEAEIKH